MTSTALATTTPHSAPVLSPHQMERLGAEAKLLARSTLIPANLRNKPDQIVSIALWGHAIGLPSMTAACQAIVMIGDNPFVRPVGLGGVLNSRGYRWAVEDSSAERCVIVGRCPNDPVGWPLRRATYTMDEAVKGQLTRNQTYGKFPADMLFHRCLGRWVKQNAPEVLYGITAAGVGIADEHGRAEPFTEEDQAAADAILADPELVDDHDVPVSAGQVTESWQALWSAACKQHRIDRATSSALLSYACARSVTTSTDVTDQGEREAALHALGLFGAGELVLVDGRIAEKDPE